MFQRLRDHKVGFQFILAGVIIITAILLYRPLFDGQTEEPLYPWGSDTLGHVFRFEYLEKAIQDGDFYPDIFPDWYLGIQLQRYYPPLPYYLLIILKKISGNSILAVNIFIVFAAGIGGLSLLLYQRWLKWPLSLAGGLLYLAFPDHLRVAFAEGNIPRVLANACIPLLIYLLIRLLEEGPNRNGTFAVASIINLVVLSHPMMGAIFAVVSGVLILVTWIARLTTYKTAAHALATISLGLLLTAWWLFPSLTGGITELNSSAVSRGLDVVPWSTFFNPTLRSGNPEIIYVGISLLILPIPLLVMGKTKTQQSLALVATGLFGTLIVTPGFNSLFTALPLASLLWPIRFLGIAGLLLLLAILWGFEKLPARLSWISVTALLLIGLDFSGSFRLIHLRPLRTDIRITSEKMKTLSGWREATLDFSRLGSAPSYLFTAEGNREQVFGWAYQGARTAANVASLNEALRLEEYPYLQDRLNLYGVDDVVFLKEDIAAEPLQSTLGAEGFQKILDEREIAYFNRSGDARAIYNDWRALGIGSGAQNFAYLFPQVILGNSPFLDDYTAAVLGKYEKIILSGFTWHDRDQAELLVEELAAAGVQIFIDLTGAPPEPLARIPQFLGIWAEPVILAPEPLQAKFIGQTRQLGPFGTADELWYTHVPQGLPNETVEFDHLGETAAIAGSIQTAGEPIWFIGINLAYQAVVTDDEGSLATLAEVIGLPARTTSLYQTLPLNNFRATSQGYSFGYHLDKPETLLIPIAHHDGTALYVEGSPVPTSIP